MESGAHREQPAQPAPQSVRSSFPLSPGRSLSGSVSQVQNLGRHPMLKGAPRFLGSGCLPIPQVKAVDGGVLGEAKEEWLTATGGHSGYL